VPVFRIVDLSIRQALYDKCRDEPLAPEDERNVDFDRLTKDAPVRGVSWVERLAGPIELSPRRPVRRFVTGLPGSGKSTELRRLALRLGRPDGANLLVVSVDAEQVIDLAQPVDVPDIIMVLVDAAERRVLELEGHDPAGAMQERYLTRVWHWLTSTNVALDGLNLGGDAAGVPGELAVKLKTEPSFRQRVRETLATHFSRFLAEARTELLLLQERVQRAGRAGLCLLFDSLEKNRGISTNWNAVLDSAERVFGAGAPHLDLPVHSIYTVPAAMVGRRVGNIEFMPVIKLRDREGTTFAPGYGALRTLVRRRIQDPDLFALLGSDAEARIERLIERSGGYPREIVQALRWIIELPEHPATDDDLERLHMEARERYRAVVLASDVPWLASVARTKTLTTEDDGHRLTVDRALQNNVVLRYCNRDVWYDLHPAVYDIEMLQQALADGESDPEQ
jgi:hypothetical protein